MKLLETLNRAADEEQLRQLPLSDHAAATQAEHMRHHYALLAAAVLTAQSIISEPQTRLLRLLLDALKLGDIRGTLFEQARELTPERLLEAARLIREAGSSQHFILDALVLLRLDAPLSDEAACLVNELAAFLGSNEEQLAMRVSDATDILGIKINFNKNEHYHTNKKFDFYSFQKNPKILPWLLDFWLCSLVINPITADNLFNGLDGGLWILEDNLDIDFPWSANNAIIIFKNKAALSSSYKKEESKSYKKRESKITDCLLIDVVLNFSGRSIDESSITLERCDWQGNYSPMDKRTALSSGINLNLIDCNFSTLNARAIIAGSHLLIERSKFLKCGNWGIGAGAIQFSGRSIKIEECKFLECKGEEAGAISSISIKDINIKNCEFISCIGKKEKYFFDENEEINDIAICMGNSNFLEPENIQDPPIMNCFFWKASIYFSLYSGKSRLIAKNSRFTEGNIYLQPINISLWSYKGTSYNCVFSNCGIKDVFYGRHSKEILERRRINLYRML